MKILIAEFSARVRSELHQFCEMLGHTVVAEAKTGEETVKLFQSAKPDLVMLDVEISQLDCLTVITKILKMDPSAKIGLVTSPATIKIMLEARKAGACAYLYKPIKKDKLVDFFSRIVSIDSAA